MTMRAKITTQERREAAIAYYTMKDGAEVVEYLGHLFISYTVHTSKGLKNAMAYFGPKSQKAQSDVWYKSIEAMVNHMCRIASNIDSRIKEIKSRSEKAKEAAGNMKAGDVLNTSWGYDQTNVEFYLVTEVKGVTVTLQEVAQTYVKEGNMSGEVMPVLESKIGEPFKKRISAGGYVKTDRSCYASLWSGRPCYTSNYA